MGFNSAQKRWVTSDAWAFWCQEFSTSGLVWGSTDKDGLSVLSFRIMAPTERAGGTVAKRVFAHLWASCQLWQLLDWDALLNITHALVSYCKVLCMGLALRSCSVVTECSCFCYERWNRTMYMWPFNWYIHFHLPGWSSVSIAVTCACHKRWIVTMSILVNTVLTY